MIKVFTTNKDNKIELTKDELKNLLDEVYWDGFRAHNQGYIYYTPNWTPCNWTSSNNNITLNTNDIQKKNSYLQYDIKYRFY